MRSRIVASSAVGLLWAAIAFAQPATPTPVDSNVAVSDYAQSHGQNVLGIPCASRGGVGCGGCYPEGVPPSNPLLAALAQLTTVNPEWQAIGPMIPGLDTNLAPVANPVLVTGTIGLSKSPGDDFPASHQSSDYNAEIIPDDNSKLGTGNGPGGTVEFEWEHEKYPLFAWGGEGDRVIALGRWIFDCGHPDPGPLGACSNDSTQCVIDSDCTSPGTCTNPLPTFGYQSEMHPPQASVMIRSKGLRVGRAMRPATRADVYISSDGGAAADRCTVTHRADPSDVLFKKACYLNHCSVTTNRSCHVDKDCAHGETCITLDPNARLANVNQHDFAFDMPLPPPPGPSATLKITTKSFKPKGALMPKPIFVVPAPLGPTPSLHVIVPMSQPLAGGKMPNVFAESISAAWKEDPTALTHVQVKFKSITINNPLKDSVPAITRVCTNPTGSLTSVACTTNADCSTGMCAISSSACHTNADCRKTDYCFHGSQCVGGIIPGWNMWAEVNGDWVQLTKLSGIGQKSPFAGPPYLQPSSKPLVVPESFTFDEDVPANSAIHIKMDGQSLNCLNTVYGNNLKDGLNEVGLVPGANCLAAGSHDPGKVDVTHDVSNLAGVSGCTAGQPTTCTITSSGGNAGTCSVTTSKLCVTDADCPGHCTLSGQPCSADGDCKHCSVTTSQFCAEDRDCPTGACSVSPTTRCHVASDCPSGACSSGSQTCVAATDTCTDVESCNVSGGAFTLQYTIGIKP